MPSARNCCKTGPIDGRAHRQPGYKGKDQSGVSEYPDYDPSLNVIWPPFTTTLNQYFRTELGYENDAEYHILRSLDWDWGDAKDGYSDTSAPLREAMAKNPYMRVYVASGYYDLATPYYATIYTLNHMGLDPTPTAGSRLRSSRLGTWCTSKRTP